MVPVRSSLEDEPPQTTLHEAAHPAWPGTTGCEGIWGVDRDHGALLQKEESFVPVDERRKCEHRLPPPPRESRASNVEKPCTFIIQTGILWGMSREPTNYTRTCGPEEGNLQEMQFTHLCCQMSGCQDNKATENTHNETKTQKLELRVRNSAPGSTEEGSGRDLREERAKATSEMEVRGHATGRPAGMCRGPLPSRGRQASHTASCRPPGSMLWRGVPRGEGTPPKYHKAQCLWGPPPPEL